MVKEDQCVSVDAIAEHTHKPSKPPEPKSPLSVTRARRVLMGHIQNELQHKAAAVVLKLISSVSSPPPCRGNRTISTACFSPAPPRSSSTMPWLRRLWEVRCVEVSNLSFHQHPPREIPQTQQRNNRCQCLNVRRCSGRLQWDDICLRANVFWKDSHNGGKKRKEKHWFVCFS